MGEGLKLSKRVSGVDGCCSVINVICRSGLLVLGLNAAFFNEFVAQFFCCAMHSICW